MVADASDAQSRDDRLHDVIAACLEDAECGRLEPAAVLARHPEFAAELDEFFTGRDLLEGAAEQLRAESPPGGPDFLGDYRLVREVGRGGMGVVYEAEQRSLRRRVALKVLPFAAAVDALQLQRFHHEAQAAAQLHHSHIVPVFAVGCERGVHYYAMQFIDGRTLADLIRDLRHDPDELPSKSAGADTGPVAALTTERNRDTGEYCKTVARWAVHAAEALDHAHNFGVVHRDIKPANLMVDVHGHVWVTDFGLARLQGEPGLTQSGDLLGTLRYMSPEQVEGQPTRVDARSDVYSLGATLYELLALTPAVPGTDRQQVMRQVVGDDPRPLRGHNPAIPADLETIVHKAMAKDAAERYGSAGELAADLERFLADQPIRARRPTVLGRTAKWLRRHRALVRGVVAALAAAVLALGACSWMLWRQAGQVHLEKERAEGNLRLAMDSLEQLYLRAAEDRFPRDPEWERQNRDVLQTALTFYEALAQQNADELAVRRRAARAYGRVGEICRRLERPDDAENAYRRAVALGEVIVAESAGDASDREQLADTLMNYGILLQGVRRAADGERVQRRAWGLYRDLAAERPNVPARRRSLASCSQNLADVLQLAGRPRDAEASYRQALAVREELLAEHPADPALQEDLANTLQSLGRLLHGLSRNGEAEALFRRALPMLQALTARYPERVRYRQVLANGRTLLAYALRDGHPKQAEEELGRALAESQALAAEFPGVPEYRRRLAGNHNLLGILLTESGRLTEAEGHYRQAVDLLTAVVARPHLSKGRSDLADCHHNWGILLRKRNAFDDADKHLRDALALRRKLVEDVPDVPVHWEHLGQSYQELGSLAMDRKLPQKAEEVWREGLPILERLARDWGDEPAHRRALASGHYNLARAALSAGHLPEAEADCRRAIDIHARMAAEFPAVAPYRHVLSRDRDFLGMIHEAAGRPAEAEDSFRQAAAVEKALTREHTAAEYRFSLATSLLHLQGVVEKGGRDAEAEDLVREALALLERLVADAPAAPKFRHELANTLTRLAHLLVKVRRPAEAEQAYRQVLVHYRRLVEDSPNHRDYRAKSGRAHVRLAMFLAQAQRLAEAEEAYREAIRLNPDDAVAPNNLAWILATAADASRLRPADAVTLAKRAVELGPRDRDHWGTLGAAYYRAGDLAAAKDALERATALTGGRSGCEEFFLAMTWARLGDAAKARACYEQAVAWMEAHRPRDAELRRFRTEADAALQSPAAPTRPEMP